MEACLVEWDPPETSWLPSNIHSGLKTCWSFPQSFNSTAISGGIVTPQPDSNCKSGDGGLRIIIKLGESDFKHPPQLEVTVLSCCRHKDLLFQCLYLSLAKKCCVLLPVLPGITCFPSMVRTWLLGTRGHSELPWSGNSEYPLQCLKPYFLTCRKKYPETLF